MLGVLLGKRFTRNDFLKLRIVVASLSTTTTLGLTLSISTPLPRVADPGLLQGLVLPSHHRVSICCIIELANVSL